MNLFIGLDLDNTLACYDQLMHRLALEQGWIKAHLDKSKQTIRDHLRTLPQGELLWQRLQGLAYGPHMPQARPFPGVLDTLRYWATQGIRLAIISHKTCFATHDPTRTNLRDQALCWLEKNGFFQGTGLSPRQVFFSQTREDKIRQISVCQCTHFIDDLVETFLHAHFPPGVVKILFAPHQTRDIHPDNTSRKVHLRMAKDWSQIRSLVENGFTASKIHPGGIDHPGHSKVILDCQTILGHRATWARRIYAGLNSRVFVLRFEHHPPVVLKYYTGLTGNGRLRGEADFTNHQILWQAGERAIAQPLAISRDKKTALFSYLQGQRIDCSQAKKTDIEQCLEFLERINNLQLAFCPGRASEACFSLKELAQNLRQRTQTLLEIQAPGPEYEQLKDFLQKQLGPCIDSCMDQAIKVLHRHNVSRKTLPRKMRWLSPSDFGLHNALKDGNKLFFLDFEHLGYDDPVKTCADFLLHPRMSGLGRLRSYFVSRVREKWQKKDSAFSSRLQALLPLFCIKWSLILLNEFLPRAQQRRARAMGENISPDILNRQLHKARAMLQQATHLACSEMGDWQQSTSKLPDTA